MPSLSEEGDPGDNRPFSLANLKRRDMIILVVFAVLMMFMLRNVMMRDYDAETKSYLTSIGRKDAIDNVIPKTYQEVVQERKNKDKLIDSLAANVTILMNEYKALRSEVDLLKPKTA